MTGQLDTSAVAIAALLERVDEWWDYDHGNIFKDVANLLPALSLELTALRDERDQAVMANKSDGKIVVDMAGAMDKMTPEFMATMAPLFSGPIIAMLEKEHAAITAERDAALARVGVLEKALSMVTKPKPDTNEIREKWYPYGGGETL